MNKIMNSAKPDQNDNSLWPGGSQDSSPTRLDIEAHKLANTDGVPNSKSAPSLDVNEIPDKIDAESVKFVMEMRKRRFACSTVLFDKFCFINVLICTYVLLITGIPSSWQ